MKLALIFNKEREDTIGCYFERAAKELDVLYDHYWTKDAAEIKGKYDLFLRIDHGDYKYDLPTYLKPSAFYVIDTHLKKPYGKIKEQVAHYDYIFCAQRDGTERLRRDVGVNAMWVPIGCDPKMHKRLEIEKRFDIAFVGTEGKKNLRGQLLKMLARRHPNNFIGKADFRLLSNIYSSAKIGFNYSINNDINMRMFEVLSCGALLITNYIRDNGFEELFSDGLNVVAYKSPVELFQKIDYYLAHEEERERIAKEGHLLAIVLHTYKERLRKMLEVVGCRSNAI
ncbi:MAG: glycosyltransferase [Candidatus Omnitrophota bacterium]